MLLLISQLLQKWTYKLYELADDITWEAEKRERARR